MMLPDICYRPTELDLSGVLAEFVTLYALNIQSAQVVTTPIYTVPKGKLLVLQKLVMVLSPGATYVAKTGEVYFTYLGIIRFLAGATVNPAIPAADTVYVPLVNEEIVLPQEIALIAEGTFSNGVNTNYVAVHGIGWLIPRGSVAI